MKKTTTRMSCIPALAIFEKEAGVAESPKEMVVDSVAVYARKDSAMK